MNIHVAHAPKQKKKKWQTCLCTPWYNHILYHSATPLRYINHALYINHLGIEANILLRTKLLSPARAPQVRKKSLSSAVTNYDGYTNLRTYILICITLFASP